MSKIFGVGLPRSGGQTLQLALHALFPTAGWILHSPGKVLANPSLNFFAAVEVFAPFSWLENHYPGSIYLYNRRDFPSWLKSCKSVYLQSAPWNHPIWKYPLPQFEAYYHEHYQQWLLFRNQLPLDQQWRCAEIDLIQYPNWTQLCDALHIPRPILTPFPRADRVKGVLHRPGLQTIIQQQLTQIPLGR